MAAVAAACALAILGSTLVTVYLYSHPIPFNDSWETLELYRAYLDGSLSPGHLFAQHFEHRIFFSRLLILADFRFAAGTGAVLIVFMLLLQAAHVLLMDAALGKEAGVSRAGRVFFLATAFTFFFWLKQRENFVWGFQVVWMINGLSASLGAFLIAGARASSTGLARAGRLAGAALCCVVGAYSLANGVLLGFVLAVLLWKAGLPRREQVLWGIFCLALTAVYLRGYQSPAQHASLPDALHWETLKYAAVYLGNPVAGAGIRGILGLVLGISGLVGFACFAWRFFRAGNPSFHQAFAFAVMAYVVLTGMVTAVGRHNAGAVQAASNRYLTAIVVFWLVFATRAYLEAGEARRRWVLRAVLVVTAFFLLPLQVEMARRMKDAWLKLDEASLALVTGVDDTAALAAADPWNRRRWERNDFMKRNRLSVYREAWPHLVGVPRETAFDREPGPVLEGRIDETRAFDGFARDGLFLRGRLLPAPGEKPPGLIFFARRDTIVGFARTEGRSCTGCFSGYARGGGALPELFVPASPDSRAARPVRLP
ncbi:MAG: hypothetical protein K0Q91_833 [Fibrobacteria bacterium]|jgi:hypothetical protein|nr:hypothetical protein [Fibrobacteria bacterium]